MFGSSNLLLCSFSKVGGVGRVSLFGFFLPSWGFSERFLGAVLRGGFFFVM